MKDILTGIGAYFAMTKVFKMLTNPLNQVPGDWLVIRCLIVVSAVMGFGMFTAYAVNFMVSYWPF